MGDYRDRRRNLKQHTFGGSDRHSKSAGFRRKEERLDREHRVGTEGQRKRQTARSEPVHRRPRTDTAPADEGPPLAASHPDAAHRLMHLAESAGESS